MKENVEALLKSLEEDMLVYGEYLLEIARSCLKENISAYPIFIAHQEEAIGMGTAVISREQTRTNWSINASHLKDFINNNIIDQEKEANFAQVFKDPREFACVFVLRPNFSNFIFTPYPPQEQQE